MELILSSGFLPLKIADFLTAQDMLRTRCVCRQWSASFDLEHMVRRVARLEFKDLAILGSVPDRLLPHHSFSKLGDLDLALYTPALAHASSSRTVSTRSSSSVRSLGTPAPSRAAGATELHLPSSAAPPARGSAAATDADSLAGLPVPRVRRADRSALAASLTADGGAPSSDHSSAVPAHAFAAAASAARGSSLSADGGVSSAAAGRPLAAATASPPSSPKAAAAVVPDGAARAMPPSEAAGGAGAGAAARPVTPPRSTPAAAAAEQGDRPLPLLPATPATPASWRSVGDGTEPPLDLDPCSWVAQLSKDGDACARIRCLRVCALLPEAVLSSLLARCSRLERLDAAKVDRIKDTVSRSHNTSSNSCTGSATSSSLQHMLNPYSHCSHCSDCSDCTVRPAAAAPPIAKVAPGHVRITSPCLPRPLPLPPTPRLPAGTLPPGLAAAARGRANALLPPHRRRPAAPGGQLPPPGAPAAAGRPAHHRRRHHSTPGVSLRHAGAPAHAGDQPCAGWHHCSGCSTPAGARGRAWLEKTAPGGCAVRGG